MKKTLERIRQVFYWKKMRKEIGIFLVECKICQRNKDETVSYLGLLQPLPISEQVWTNISMDFIEGLPTSHGKQVIFVVVDRLSKYAHFMPLSHPYTALNVAQAFMDNVYKLHGLSKSIVSDRDPVFTSNFWKGLFVQLNVGLLHSTAYHPQIDGQTQIVNKCLEQYLRCMIGDKPKEWTKWLPLAEWWYNTSNHLSTQITPFEGVNG